MNRRSLLAGTAAGAALLSGSIKAMAKAASIGENMLDHHDAIGLAQLVRTRQVSPTELLDLSIKRAEETNPQFNFMAHKLYDYARDTISNGLPEGPFTGVPWLLKDLHTHIEGQPSGQGSRSYDGYIAPYTSELVKRHQAAGLVIFGKTTSPEFGLTGTTESQSTGITRNPWNPERIAGGSSGGAAAAVAAGVLPAAHATDGGGSIRIPASCCGLFGLKPSRGRVPMGPNRTEGWGGMSANHVVTRSVRDSAALMDATAGTEPGSRYSAPSPDDSFLSYTARAPRPLKVALVLTPPAGSPVDPECIGAARDAAVLLESLGHHVEEAQPTIDMTEVGQANFAAISTSLVASIDERAAATGIAPSTDVLEHITMMFYNLGKQMDGVSVSRAHYVFQQVAYDMARFMDDYDIILSPTVATPPPMVGTLDLQQQDFQAWGQRVAAFTPFAGTYNITGQPSASLPLGMSSDGLPIGVMMSARYGAEALLFQLAAQVELAQPWWEAMAAAPGRA